MIEPMEIQVPDCPDLTEKNDKEVEEEEKRLFTVIGPKIIRPNSTYNISVNAHDNLEPIKLKVGIRDEKNAFESSKEIIVDPNTSQLIKFENENLKNEIYDLFAELSALTPEKTPLKLQKNIKLCSKLYSVFIQSDKGMYKAGDIVRFRFIMMNAQLKPVVTTGPINVYIMDPKDNRIKQWLNVKMEYGVYTSEFQLSDFPLLGKWQIVVNTTDKTFKKIIEVAEYVLPKFQVSIDVPKHFTYKNEKLFGIVKSSYTYGKPVKGEAKITVYTDDEYNPMQKIVEKTISIDGKASFEFDFKDELKVNAVDYGKQVKAFKIHADVEEKLTGLKRNGSAKFTVHETEYQLKILKNVDGYKPKIPFEILFQVLNHDGTQITPMTDDKIIVYHGCHCYDDENMDQREFHLDKIGSALVLFNVPYNNLIVKVKYLNEIYSLGYYHRLFDKTPDFLELNLITENKPKIGDEIKVQLKCTEKLDQFTYQIIGFGNILANEMVKLDGHTMEYELKFNSTIEMLPRAHVIVYYKKDKEIVSSRLEIEFQTEFVNHIELKPSTENADVEPGQNINFIIKSNPNSFVGLLGIDQSVLLLKDGNDFSKDDIFNDLNQYSENHYVYTDMWQRNFDLCGTVVLSNAVTADGMCQERTFCKKIGLFGAGMVKKGSGAPMLMMDCQAYGMSVPVFEEMPVIRTEFPETWIWDQFNVNGADGTFVLNKTVPDTITSWIITGFSMDPINGFGLTKTPTELKVFQPFFISLNLPYSIKCGESIAISACVFNYMEFEVNAEITLHNEGEEFDFIEKDDAYSEKPQNNMNRKKRLNIDTNSGSTISFMIKPKKVGIIKIKITALTPLAGDGIERLLPVEPEGTPQYFTKSSFIDLRDSNINEELYEYDIPKEAVPDSTRIVISVVGDLLGAAIKNLDGLIRMPYGCGEQNMINFVPNIVILQYLKCTNQLTETIELKCKRYMESGYQRELNYRRIDGSFSVFGKHDQNGSTWLTAFVARSFRQAAIHISIEEKIIEDALKWLSTVQTENGNFPEVGHVYHTDLQGGSGSGVGLTAYILTAFLENKDKIKGYQNTIDKAIKYIIDNLGGLNEVYTLTIASYALQMANHTEKIQIMEKLNAKANIKDDKKWWNKATVEVPDDKAVAKCYELPPNSVNIEMTAYAMLSYLESGQITEAIPIMKWLIGQQNDKGGFQSTQDTVVGLQALGKFAEKIASNERNIEINCKYENSNDNHRITVNNDNAIVLQALEIPPAVRSIKVSSKGKGFSVLQLAYQYNISKSNDDQKPRFSIKAIIDKAISKPEYLCLSITTSYIPNGNDILSNMAVMEVSLPSGFVADKETFSAIEQLKNVKKVETKNADTIVMVYYDNMSATKVITNINAIRSHIVNNIKPSSIFVYDYYDNSRCATEFYEYK